MKGSERRARRRGSGMYDARQSSGLIGMATRNQLMKRQDRTSQTGAFKGRSRGGLIQMDSGATTVLPPCDLIHLAGHASKCPGPWRLRANYVKTRVF